MLLVTQTIAKLDPSCSAEEARNRPDNDRCAGREKQTVGRIMSSEITHQILQTIEEEVNSRPSPIEFEMAYQARVAIDRIRFAIKHTEQYCPRSDQLREAGLQLLDALERLETVDRRFQMRSRICRGPRHPETVHARENGNGKRKGIFS